MYNGEAWVIHTQDGNTHIGNGHLDNPTGAVRAPRTAVGLDKDSNLMLLVVDGCQRW